MEKVVIIGAGSWGTALGLVLATNGYNVVMWEYNRQKAEELQQERENKVYLPDIKFPDNITITWKKEELLKNTKYVIFSVPSQVLRGVVREFSSQITEDMILVNTAKGIEMTTGMRLSEVMKDEILGKYHKNIVVLSGPTHAEEVAKGLPTTIVAGGVEKNTLKIQELFNNKNFRVYINEDIAGIEIGGAIKNCLAIGAGIADGMGYGDNTKAALITRGIAEMVRFGRYFGADERTFSGLTGIGDLIVTCASKHSRNRYVGENLGKGRNIDEILSEMTMVAEGVPTTKAVFEIAEKNGISMPIVEATYNILYKNASAKEMVKNLMERELKVEFY